jgi:predicted MPP superfamily phosphohydrolase
MSHDWPWPVKLALVVPPALGHVYLFVLVINVGSGLGFRERLMDRVRMLLFAGFWASSAVLLVKHASEPWWTWNWPLQSYAWACVIAGLLVFPFCSWRIARRRRPDGITGKSRTIELARSLGAAPLIGRGRRSWLLHLPGNESFRLALREWDVTMPTLPGRLEGLSIVQLSDFHLARCYERLFFESIITACLGWHADLICITGDLVEDDATIDWIEPLLGPLEARVGKFAILGNHDKEHLPEAIVRELDRAGFELLEGRWTTCNVEGTTLAVGGTSAPWGPALEGRDVPPADFRVLLSHSPDQLYNARSWGIDLMLAGHNHGGQIRLPMVGPVFMPSRYSRRFDRGFFRAGGTLLYVSEGIGGKHPVRYGCAPEIGRFVLHAGTGALEPDRQTASRAERVAIGRDLGNR